MVKLNLLVRQFIVSLLYSPFSFSNNNYNMRNIYMDNSNFKINDFQKTPHRRSLSSSNLDTSAGKSSQYFIHCLISKNQFLN